MSKRETVDHEDTGTRKKSRSNGKGEPHDEKTKAVNENRKLAQASRALRACESCRRQKTRCFRSSDNINSCLRCTFLKKTCSFENAYHNSAAETGSSSNDTSKTHQKLDMIYSGISQVLDLLKHGAHGRDLDNDARLLLEAASTLSNTDPSKNAIPPNHDFEQNDIEEHPTFQSPTDSLRASPFSVVINQVPGPDIPPAILKLLHLSTVKQPNKSFDDIISRHILTKTEAVSLISDFRRNYGRWVSFPKNLKAKELVDSIRSKSSLLLTTCCCLSLRFTLNGISPGDINNFQRRKRTYRELGKHLVKEISDAVSKNSSVKAGEKHEGDIEFLQALVILSIYSMSLSSIINGASESDSEPYDSDGEEEESGGEELKDLNLDPWFLSSVGLTTFLTKSTFGHLFNQKASLPNELTTPPFLSGPGFLNSAIEPAFSNIEVSDEYQTLTILRIYNHLCLVHIMNCVFSGRMCIVDEIRLSYCTSTLGLSSSTNFDGRMISEIGVLLIAYNYMQTSLNGSGANGKYVSLKEAEHNFEGVKRELKEWYTQWEYLIEQPTVQFVELNYNFCTMVVYFTYTYQKGLLVKTGQTLQQLDDKSTIYNEDNMDFVLRNADSDSLYKILYHSFSVVRFINAIESDSYFAYLSDQVHFSFYYSGVCLMKTVMYLLESKQKQYFMSMDLDSDEDNYENVVGVVQSLIVKFKTVGQDNANDIITKYEKGLSKILADLTSVQAMSAS